MWFVEVLIRQAHPGYNVPAYTRFEQKLRDAGRYRLHESLPWPVLVDDIRGTVHQVYGGLSDPSYLIDADGRVAYHCKWTYVPTLHAAIDALLRQGGRGIANGGLSRRVHLMPTIADGWRGIRRGIVQSYIDLETALPGSATTLLVGHWLRPLLAPIALRYEPLPRPLRLLLPALAALPLMALALLARSRRTNSDS